MPDLTITRNDTASRYEAHLDGARIGFADFTETGDGRMVVPHTEIDPAQEGNGYGGQLVKFVLDDARQRELKVVPACPFVGVYVRRHPEYADVIA